jgi:signal transduction histidine kinase/CheY-like chemotaxis protein
MSDLDKTKEQLLKELAKLRQQVERYKKSADEHNANVDELKRENLSLSSTVQDLTEQRQIEGNIQKSRRLESLRDLAGNIAHDFNNMLIGILTYSKQLKLKTEPDSEIYKGLDVIEEAGEHARKLTEQLLGFAKNGKQQSIPVDMHEIISEATKLFRQTIDPNISLNLELHASNSYIPGDPNQVQQVIMNLANNARDAMKKGGTLTIKTEEKFLDKKHVRFHPKAYPGEHLVISVSDTGSGISPEDLERIYEPFFTTKGIDEGNGMGLATVYGIIENHDGHIVVSSEVGQGSTFTLYIPSYLAEIEKIEKAASREISPQGGRILLVDDEAIILAVVPDILKALGYEVETAVNGKEAVQYYKKHSNEIDLVIIDMIMPEMDGRDCFVELKKINPKVRAIVSTGYGLKGEAQSIIDEGVLGFLQKPFHVEQLKKIVADALKK